MISKKKGLHQISEQFSGRNPKFKGFFRPKLGDLQKKRKKVQSFEGGCFRMGGLFSIFHTKSASKAQKACDFAYFTRQLGGARAPPPRLATLLEKAKGHSEIKLL